MGGNALVPSSPVVTLFHSKLTSLFFPLNFKEWLIGGHFIYRHGAAKHFLSFLQMKPARQPLTPPSWKCILSPQDPMWIDAT